MESKTKHRLLGVVVVAGLVVIAYPFIQSENAANNDLAAASMVKAPAFPDQSVQVAASGEDAPAIPDSQANNMPTPTPDTSTNAVNVSTAETNTPPASAEAPAASTATPSDSTATTAAPETAAPTQTAPAENAAKQPDQTTAAPSQNAPAAKTMKSTSENTPEVTPEAPSLKTALEDTNATSELQQPAPQKKKPARTASHNAKAHPVILSKLPRTAAKHGHDASAFDNNGLVKLKNSAWVIQLGSFKQKSSALKLVNKLRAKGYRAFIQHLNVASGENTNVFVGPEQHQASAKVVAAELETNLKLHGMIISYKPFTL